MQQGNIITRTIRQNFPNCCSGSVESVGDILGSFHDSIGGVSDSSRPIVDISESFADISDGVGHYLKLSSTLSEVLPTLCVGWRECHRPFVNS